MPRQFVLAPELELNELHTYHQDVRSSLRLYFSPSAPSFTERFVGKTAKKVNEELTLRIDESDVRSTFFLLTSLEAHFRMDFDFRCRQRRKDPLSRHFREVEKKRKNKVRLNEDILEGWGTHKKALTSLIREFRGALKFRHWLAHGRYWAPKYGRKYDFGYVQIVAESILSNFRFLI